MTQDVVVLHFFGNSHRVGDGLTHHIRLQMIHEESVHLFFGLDVFRAGVSQPLLVADQFAREHAKQGVMGLHILLAEVVSIVGGHQLNAKFLGNANQFDIDDPVFRRAVILDFKVEVFTENLLVPTGHRTSHIRPSPQNRLWQFTTQTGGGDHQTLAVLFEKVLINAGARKIPRPRIPRRWLMLVSLTRLRYPTAFFARTTR